MTTELPAATGIPLPGAVSFPEDLAEWLGAVRLLDSALAAGHDLPGGSAASCSDPALLTIYVYALARGFYGADEVAGKLGEDGCLRYLAGNRRWEPEFLRDFRRREARKIGAVLARLVARALGEGDSRPGPGRDPVREAGRRMTAAIRADSLALGE